MKPGYLPQILFLIGLFLLPISGGFVANDLQATEPGFSWIAALGGTADAPLLGFLLPSLCFLTSFAIQVARNRVIQIPFPPVVFALIALAITILGSNLMSEFRFASYQVTVQWMIAILSPIIATAVLGRETGPVRALGALTAGCSVIAAQGILEYASSSDPSWRIFCHWVNPNAAAGMLVFGLFCGVGITLATDRTARIASVAATVLCGNALFLTQSKGGIYAAAFGLVVLSAFGLVWGRSIATRLLPAGVAIGILIASFGLGIAMQKSAAQRVNAEVAVASRLGGATSTQMQSEGFRRLLWKTSIELIKKNPVGSGIGTFRYESTKPGIVPQTHHAHQGFLQLGVEAGVLSLVAFAGLAFLFFRETLRGATKLQPQRKALLGAALAAIIASAAHNFIDSDLQHFGSGVAFFALIGISLQLAMDGSTPEFFPTNARWSAIGWCSFLAIGSLYFADIDTRKSVARGAYQSGNPHDALNPCLSVTTMAPLDGEGWALLAQFPSNYGPEEKLVFLKKAAELSPTMRNYRYLAYFEVTRNRPQQALNALTKALQRDPNNLPALLAKVNILDSQGNFEEAKRAAKDLIRVESATSYQVRAIPDLVPTETLIAREYAASHSEDTKEQIDLRKGAIAGYAGYARLTIPQIVHGAKIDPTYRFAGEGVDDAFRCLESGERIASLLEPAGATDAEIRSLLADAREAFELAKASLVGLNR
jgi:tetratricopeptide (TPR) repeat protein